jgi:hypothetical protein
MSRTDRLILAALILTLIAVTTVVILLHPWTLPGPPPPVV